jgi:hypothetical protein
MPGRVVHRSKAVFWPVVALARGELSVLGVHARGKEGGRVTAEERYDAAIKRAEEQYRPYTTNWERKGALMRRECIRAIEDAQQEDRELLLSQIKAQQDFLCEKGLYGAYMAWLERKVVA